MNIDSSKDKLSPENQRVLKKLKEDLPFFAKNCLKIVDKSGNLTPFNLNEAQLHLHNRLQEQLSTTGMVRATVLKARQAGFSTYIGARFFHKVLFHTYLTSFVVAHLAKSTQQLYRMVETYYENLPQQLKQLCPTSAHNRNELEFASTNSRYVVGTAGSGDMGRGFTTQLMHLSEVAFYQDADAISTGLIRSVNRSPGTEIIIESTANGINNFFHNQFKAGLDPDSNYISVFVPWFASPEYQIQPSHSIILTEEERHLQELYSLSIAQLYWRRRVIQDECHGLIWKFNQEYPTCAEDAFVSSTESFFDMNLVQQARKSKYKDTTAPKVLGIDPASVRDRAAYAYRQGRTLHEYATYRDKSTQDLAAIAYNMHKIHNFDRIFIDVGNGYGVYDVLRNDYKLAAIITPVNFGQRAILSDLYADKRAEMFFGIKTWLEEGASMPDSDELASELRTIPMPSASTVRGALRFPKKREIRSENNNESTDIVDALGLTFAFPVVARAPQQYVDRQGMEVKNGTVVRKSKTLERFGVRR